MISVRLILTIAVEQPHFKEPPLCLADVIDFEVHPLHRVSIGVASVVVVPTSLRDNILHDIRLEVRVCDVALILVLVKLVQVVPMSCVILVLCGVRC